MRRVEIRLLKGSEEYRECERIQNAVWGTLAVSSELLTVTQKYGGAVLGAIVEGKIVGFVYAFLARRRGRLVHWSHMMAVRSGYRDLGLGFRMKLAHRELALKQGLSAICWTYDPLQSRNATLNIARLGACSDEYIPDCYGQFPSVIEKGLPSDRFAVEWRIASPGVKRRLAHRSSSRDRLDGKALARLLGLPRANETRFNSDDFVENRKILLSLRAPQLLVEIPCNTDVMRERAMPLAKRWRMDGRRIFQHYFQAGYRVEDFVPPSSASGDRCFYVLRRT